MREALSWANALDKKKANQEIRKSTKSKDTKHIIVVRNNNNKRQKKNKKARQSPQFEYTYTQSTNVEWSRTRHNFNYLLLVAPYMNIQLISLQTSFCWRVFLNFLSYKLQFSFSHVIHKNRSFP